MNADAYAEELVSLEVALKQSCNSAENAHGLPSATFDPWDSGLTLSLNRAGLLELARLCVSLARGTGTFAFVDEGSFALTPDYQLRIKFDPSI